MALEFNGSTDSLKVNDPVNTEPFSMSCWYYSNASGTPFFPLMCLAVSSHTPGNDRQMRLIIADSTGWKVGANSWSSDGYHVGFATATSSHGAWQHAAGVWASTSSRSGYFNGGSKGTNTNLNDGASGVVDELNIGWAPWSGTDDYMNGYLAECAVWDAALTDAEVAILADGFSPLLVRPQSLVFYLPGVRNKQDLIGALAFTEGGTVGAFAHPRIIYPSPAQIRRFTTAAAEAAAQGAFRSLLGVGI